MKLLLRISFALLFILLSGCSSLPQLKTSKAPLLQDKLFPSHHLFQPEEPSDIFALSEDAKEFVRQSLDNVPEGESKVSHLIKRIFEHSESGLRYQNNANFTATQTFDQQAANCLSLTIMTYAMAKYAGIGVELYEVNIPEYWTRQQGFSLLNGHINLRLTEQTSYKTITAERESFLVDFDPQAIRNYFSRSTIDKNRILAMFYNNKGAQALVERSDSKAYAYFKKAAEMDPTLVQTWTNLGVLYRFNQAFEAAENSYQKAINLQDDNLTALENLAILFRATGREDQADDLRNLIEIRRKNNPFYHFIMGEQAFDQQEFEVALGHYRRAHEMNPQRHEFLFGLGKTYFELGDIADAGRYLKLAKERADSQEYKLRYGAKLSVLYSAVRK